MTSKSCIAIKTSVAAAEIISGRLTKDWMSSCNIFSLWYSACEIQDQVIISYWVEVNAASSCKHRNRRFLIRLHTPGNCLCQSEGLLYGPLSKSLLLKFKGLACLTAYLWWSVIGGRHELNVAAALSFVVGECHQGTSFGWQLRGIFSEKQNSPWRE